MSSFARQGEFLPRPHEGHHLQPGRGVPAHLYQRGPALHHLPADHAAGVGLRAGAEAADGVRAEHAPAEMQLADWDGGTQLLPRSRAARGRFRTW